MVFVYFVYLIADAANLAVKANYADFCTIDRFVLTNQLTIGDEKL